MIEYLQLKNVGPIDPLELEFGKRINIITGDNGLGKSFILDVAWWALTRTWRDELLPARPTDLSQKAEIAFRFEAKSKTKEYITSYDRLSKVWAGKPGRPPNPGLILYASVDGGFSVWDPARNYWRKKGDVDVPDRPDAYIFKPNDVWDGLARGDSKKLCNGLIADWSSWQDKNNDSFKHLMAALVKLSPSASERLAPGMQTRIGDDSRYFPTIRMPHGQDVPVIYASAGIKRIIGLAYLLVWAWQEHQLACQEIGDSITRQIIFLIDEVECHLHPKWQRSIIESLLNVVTALEGASDTQVQIIAATHSPLLLASLEPLFGDDRDAWFDIDLRGDSQGVTPKIVKRDWMPHGGASSWLMSEAFDLGGDGSIPAERAIQKAKQAWLDPNLTPDQLKVIHDELRRVLKDADPFWPRWIYFAEKKGISL